MISVVRITRRCLFLRPAFAFHAKLIGVLAQLVERLNGIEEVRGSNPLGSTSDPVYPLARIFTVPVLAPT
jgi:hypothetical protein